MVDTKIETKPHSDNKPVNPRDAIREARQRRLRVIAGNRPTTLKVYAANETFRDLLRHPGGARFRDDGSADWPNDSFTQRRIAEGSVNTESAGSGEMAEPDELLNPRQQAAAMKTSTAKAEAKETKPAEPAPQPQPYHEPAA